MVLLWLAFHASYRLKIHLPSLFKVPEPPLPANEDNEKYTVMSYVDAQDGTSEPNSYMLYDYASLQKWWGANTSVRAGNDTYSAPTNAQRYVVWDGSGSDNIQAGSAQNVTIDLREGAFSSIDGTDDLVIAYGSNIEQAEGVTGNDTLQGNALDNLIVGGNGNDTLIGAGGNDNLNGGLGTDTAIFQGNREAYSFVFENGTLTVTGEDGVDTVTEVEFFQFSDSTVNVDELTPSQWLVQPDNIKLTAATYQFLTGKIPTTEGFEYLIDSRLNNNDLNDPYYEQFNQENRYINFANNLGAIGEGKQEFTQEYGALSFEQTVRSAFTKITGGNAEASIQFFLSAQNYYQTVAQERVVPAGVALDLATKVVAVGSILNEVVKSGAGTYATAVDAFSNEIQTTGTSSHLGMDLFSVA